MKKLIITTLALVALVITFRPTATMAQDEVVCETDYIVQADDWLSKIADKTYGDMFAYPTIITATNTMAEGDSSYATIDNPDLIELGWKLCLPAASETSDIPGTVLLPAQPTPTATPVAETQIREIPLTGPLADGDAQISGLTWYGDHLILLPQYPNFFTEEGDGFLFAIPKSDLMAFLDGTQSDPLTPLQIPFIAPGLQEEIAGFEGYEAIVFVGDEQGFLTIEAETEEGVTGYLVSGSMASDLSALTLDTTVLAEIEPQSEVGNMSEETMLVTDEGLVTIYEANGTQVNDTPVGHRFSLTLTSTGTISFPQVEYRITDATGLDENNRFWAINYFFPGDEALLPETDPLAEAYGEGPTHSQNEGVERLVEFQYSETGITLTDVPPIQLELLAEDLRNWEGLVRLDDLGFLIATDSFPETILGFVPLSDEN